MININQIGLMPNDNINRLNKEQLIKLFTVLWKDIIIFKGHYYKEEKAVDGIAMVVKNIYRNYDILTVNDVVVAIEKSISFDEVTKLSPEYFIKIIQKLNNEKRELESKKHHKQNNGVFDSNYGKAINIRLLHDPKGLIMEREKFTLEDIYQGVLRGVNIYTKEPVTKNTNTTGIINKLDE